MTIDPNIYLFPILYAAVFVLCGCMVVCVLYNRIGVFLKKISHKTDSVYDDLVYSVYQSVSIRVLYLLTLTFGLLFFIPFPDFIDTVLRTIQVALLLFIVAGGLIALFEKIIALWVEKNAKSQSARSLGEVAVTIIKIVIWLFGLVILLGNLGIDVTALIAGIGISGIAVAFATQKILADVFSSFVIFLDKNILVGDWIETGSYSGTVEKIGIKTTNVRSAFGEEIIIPNDQIVSTIVRNARTRRSRRVDFEFNVDGETTPKKLAEVPGIITTTAQTIPTVTVDRCHLADFSSGYFVFKAVYHESSDSYNDYAIAQGAFNIEVVKALNKKNINIVNPRYVHVG